MHIRDSVNRIGRLMVFAAFAIAGAPGAGAADFAIIAPDTIAVTGLIDLGDCARWKATLTPAIKAVTLTSSGGRAGQGECISRSIAMLHLKTIVPQKCSSICFLLFAAGAERSACDGARIGVHRPSDVQTSEESADPKYLNRILDYAQRYGVPDSIRQKLADTPSRTIYHLTAADLEAMNVMPCSLDSRAAAGAARQAPATAVDKQTLAGTCSKLADDRGLHGQSRWDFRAGCLSGQQ